MKKYNEEVIETWNPLPNLVEDLLCQHIIKECLELSYLEDRDDGHSLLEYYT